VPKKHGTPWRQPPTLLIVDDDPLILVALDRHLRREGFQVLTCSTIESALETLDHWTVSAVIVDIKLAGADGMTLVEAVHRWHRGVSVVILTGLPDGCAEAHARGLPCVEKGDGSFRELVRKLRASLGYGPHG